MYGTSYKTLFPSLENSGTRCYFTTFGKLGRAGRGVGIPPTVLNSVFYILAVKTLDKELFGGLRSFIVAKVFM